MDKKNVCVLVALVLGIGAGISAYFYATQKTEVSLAFTLILILATAVAVVAAVLFSRAGKTGSQKNYRKKLRYMSPAEQSFLRMLRIIVGPRYEVCPQAPLVSVVEKVNGAFRNELFRVIDYVIFDIATAEPKLLVELNDASHNRSDRAERDRKVAEICDDAGIPLVAFTNAEAADEGYVKKVILKNLK